MRRRVKCDVVEEARDGVCRVSVRGVETHRTARIFPADIDSIAARVTPGGILDYCERS